MATSGTSDIRRQPSNIVKYNYTTFGPFEATQGDVDLALMSDRPIVVDDIFYIMAVKPSVGSNVNIWKRLGGTDLSIAAVVTAARAVVTAIDINVLAALVLRKFTLAVDGSGVPDHNIISPGDSLVLDFATTTAMVNFKLIVKWHFLELY